MDLLVVGSGAREHALIWCLRNSQQVGRLFALPGNAGTSTLATNVEGSVTDVPHLVSEAKALDVGLTIIGPETSLANGVVDAFQMEGLPIVGPSKRAAQIETSKSFAKTLMRERSIPTGKFQEFDSFSGAKSYIESLSNSIVVKADGLAAGKGVSICHSRDHAINAAYDLMETGTLGEAGRKILVEEFLVGREVSVFAFTDGTTVSPLIAACDYKRVYDGDAGANTGGMGSYSPPGFWSPDLSESVMRTIISPTLIAMEELGIPYQGVLYAGVILTEQGPKVLEFNCRLGDPEAQVLLPRLVSDPVDLFLGIANRDLHQRDIRWSPDSTVGVVLTSGGYPDEYELGYPIRGLGQLDDDVALFHAGTACWDPTIEYPDGLVTAGGRVLTVVGKGPTLEQAWEKVYNNVARVHFEGMHYRRDIALTDTVFL